MKIETSMKISGLPRDGWFSTTGANIEFQLNDNEYTIAEAIEIRDALTRVIEYASFGAPELAAEKREPRAFQPGDHEPTDVATVIDRDGSVWWKGPDRWGLAKSGGHAWVLWSDVLQYAPLVEVIEP